MSRAGTGLVQPDAATKTQAVAFGPKDEFAVNFGLDERKDQLNTSESITIRNNGTTRGTFNVTTSHTAGSPHTVTLGRTSLSIAGRARRTSR